MSIALMILNSEIFLVDPRSSSSISSFLFALVPSCWLSGRPGMSLGGGGSLNCEPSSLSVAVLADEAPIRAGSVSGDEGMSDIGIERLVLGDIKSALSRPKEV
jgi:hypothetical protein